MKKARLIALIPLPLTVALGGCAFSASDESSDDSVEASEEALGGCGDISEQGVCVGDVLKRCKNGNLIKKDCGAKGYLCGYDNEADIRTCVADPACSVPPNLNALIDDDVPYIGSVRGDTDSDSVMTHGHGTRVVLVRVEEANPFPHNLRLRAAITSDNVAGFDVYVRCSGLNPFDDVCNKKWIGDDEPNDDGDPQGPGIVVDQRWMLMLDKPLQNQTNGYYIAVVPNSSRCGSWRLDVWGNPHMEAWTE